MMFNIMIWNFEFLSKNWREKCDFANIRLVAHACGAGSFEVRPFH